MSMFGFHYRLERKAIGLVLGIIGVASIGGLFEIVPLFTIQRTVEEAPDMLLYTPLELAGRNIYIREGCYACHSQMIRTLRDEVDRYGPHSLAVESKYDHPMLWGSKRTGPDLARIGEKYSDQWQVAHLVNPRDVVPVSVMPAYDWLLATELRTDDLSGAVWIPGDGKANPTDLTQSLAKGARLGGAHSASRWGAAPARACSCVEPPRSSLQMRVRSSALSQRAWAGRSVT